MITNRDGLLYLVRLVHTLTLIIQAYSCVSAHAETSAKRPLAK